MTATLANDNFKSIFLNENDKILIWCSLKFVPGSPIYNETAFVQVMAWHRTGDKPLPEPMLTQFTDAYICGTRGRWVKSSLTLFKPLIYNLLTIKTINALAGTFGVNEVSKCSSADWNAFIKVFIQDLFWSVRGRRFIWYSHLSPCFYLQNISTDYFNETYWLLYFIMTSSMEIFPRY